MATKNTSSNGTGGSEYIFESIETVAHEFGREDLNELKDKLNAVIEAVNNLLTK